MLPQAVQDFLAQQYAVTNAMSQRYLEFLIANLMWECSVYGVELRFEIVGGVIYGMVGSGGASSGGGGVRIGSKNNTKEEREKIRKEMEKDTDSDIAVDDNGLITSTKRKENSDSKYDVSYCRLTEMKKFAEERGIYLTIGFFDDADLTDGSAFYPNGIDGKSDGPTVGISREQYSSNLKKPSIYNYLYEESFLGIYSTKVGEFTYNLSRVIGHEFFGHAYLYISGQNRFNESFAVEWENIVGALFGDPFRICYDCRFIRNGVLDLKLPDYQLKPRKGKK